MTSESTHSLALPAPAVAAVPSSTHYKVKIDGVSPQARRNTFEQEDECFLGVSLENSNFVRPKLAGMVEWISRRFRRCTVLVGDSIHRITLATSRGLAPEDALRTALALGREFVEREREVFVDPQGRTTFEFVTCGEVQRQAECARYHAGLADLYDRDERFRASVDRFALDYHAKRSAGLPPEELARRLRASAEYFLEEFAIFACLSERGPKVMLYPGSFSTLGEIAEGEHPAAPAPLRDLVTVALIFRGR